MHTNFTLINLMNFVENNRIVKYNNNKMYVTLLRVVE